FGAGRELDAFITAFRIPNLLRDLFAEGALSAAFVTTFTWRLEHEGEAAAWRLANLVVNALAIVVSAITLAGICFAPALVTAIAPGFADIPGKVELTVALTRIMFPFLLLVALAAVAMGILNTRHLFGVPAAASAFFNLGSVVGGLGCAWWLAPDYLRAAGHGAGSHDPVLASRAITGMAVGTLAGGLLQLLVQLPSLWRVGYRYRPVLCLPAAAGLAVLGVPVIGVIYQHGRFTAADTTAAAQALVGYAVGLAGYAGIKVLAPAFYALGDARTPMVVGLLSIATNFVLN